MVSGREWHRRVDNRSSEETGWDYELLPLEIGELAALDVDVTRFDPNEVAAIMAQPTRSPGDPDEVLTPPLEPRTKPGDLWQLGEHRLFCGNATKAEDTRRLMDGRTSLLATDPSQLDDYQGGQRPASEANGGAETAD